MAASASDAHPFPIYNARYRVLFPLLDADGDLVTGATTPDSEISQDCGTFADATNEMTEIATNSGMYYLDLIATETDCKSVGIIAKSAASGMKTTPLVLYPVRLPVIRTGTAQAGGASSITLDANASAINDYYVGCYVNITNNSPANALGQARKITAYNGSTKVATVEGTYGTNPSSASTFEVLATAEWAWRLADLQASGGTAVTSSGGRPEVNTTHAAGTAWNSGAIGASTFANNAITNSVIAADAIGSAEIADGAITAAKIASDAFTAAKFAADCLTAAKFAADCFTAAKFAADVTTEFQSGLATAANLSTVSTNVDAILAASRAVAGTSDSGTTTTMVDAARTEADDDYWNGAIILFTSGNIAGQARVITDFVASSDTITFAPATTQAVSTQNYVIIPAGDFLRPTTSGRTLDVTATGEAGIDWANVGSPGSTVNLSSTTTNLVNTVTTYTGNTPQTGDSYARIGATGSGLTSLASAANLAIVASYIDTEIATLQTDVTSILQAVRAVAGTADSGSTTTMVDAARTEADADYWKGAIILFTSGNIAGQARVITDFNAGTDTFTFAPATTQAVSTQSYIIIPHVSAWDDVLAEHLTSGSTGAALNAAGSAGDPWNTALPGAYGAGTAGKIVGDNLDATVGSRLASASYTAPDNATISTISTNVSTVLSRLGAWAGSGVNTVLGAFKALLSKAASTPSDIGGTFDPATDSTEAIRDRGDAGWLTATGFSTHTAADVWASGTRSLTVLDEDSTTLDLDATIRAAVGLASANLDSQLAAIVADTNELQTDLANGGRLDLLIDAIKAKTDLIPASPAATGDIPTAAANVAAIFAELMETGFTFKQTVRIIAAATAGKSSGAQTSTETFRGLADNADRITATVDASGNRSSITYNA